MMRIVSILLVLLLVSLVSAQEGGTAKPPTLSEEHLARIRAETERLKKEQENAPRTLAEAHARLEQMLSAEELAKIDAMPSEDGMAIYHFGLGLNIRNGWGLWKGGPLAQHMRELGFSHPDIMSGVILKTFWCNRHGQDFRLEARAGRSKRSVEVDQQLRVEQDSRVRASNGAMRYMMMGLRFEEQDVPVVQIPTHRGISVRFMRPFRDGVFLTACSRWPPRQGLVLTDGYYADPASGQARRRPGMDDSVVRGLYLGADTEYHKRMPGDDYSIVGFYLDLKDGKIRKIRVDEVKEVYAAVVAGNTAWFAGLTDGRAVLVGIGSGDRIAVPLPQEDEIPDLGLDGESLMAVYSKTIYRLTDLTWTPIHSGDILLPRSGLPPQRHGNMVFLRDEGMRLSHKRLWWLTMGERPRLRLLSRDTGLFVPTVRQTPYAEEVDLIGPPGWEETSSYCVTSTGDLWACIANGSFLLRRSQEGWYSIAMANNAVRFGRESVDSSVPDHHVSVSAITTLHDDTFLLTGNTGLYRLKGNELVQELAFAGAEPQTGPDRAPRRLNWHPTSVLSLDDGSYLIGCGSGRGVYLLSRGDDGHWSARFAEQGDPIVW